MTRKLFIVTPTFTRKFLQGAKGSNPLSCPPWKNLVVNIFILKFMFTTRFFQGGDNMVLLPLASAFSALEKFPGERCRHNKKLSCRLL